MLSSPIRGCSVPTWAREARFRYSRTSKESRPRPGGENECAAYTRIGTSPDFPRESRYRRTVSP
jgi:hypothetical protein